MSDADIAVSTRSDGGCAKIQALKVAEALCWSPGLVSVERGAGADMD